MTGPFPKCPVLQGEVYGSDLKLDEILAGLLSTPVRENPRLFGREAVWVKDQIISRSNKILDKYLLL